MHLASLTCISDEHDDVKACVKTGWATIWCGTSDNLTHFFLTLISPHSLVLLFKIVIQVRKLNRRSVVSHLFVTLPMGNCNTQTVSQILQPYNIIYRTMTIHKWGIYSTQQCTDKLIALNMASTDKAHWQQIGTAFQQIQNHRRELSHILSRLSMCSWRILTRLNNWVRKGRMMSFQFNIWTFLNCVN